MTGMTITRWRPIKKNKISIGIPNACDDISLTLTSIPKGEKILC